MVLPHVLDREKAGRKLFPCFLKKGKQLFLYLLRGLLNFRLKFFFKKKKKKILGFLTCHTSGLFKSFRNGVKKVERLFFLTLLNSMELLVSSSSEHVKMLSLYRKKQKKMKTFHSTLEHHKMLVIIISTAILSSSNLERL